MLLSHAERQKLTKSEQRELEAIRRRRAAEIDDEADRQGQAVRGAFRAPRPSDRLRAS